MIATKREINSVQYCRKVVCLMLARY